MKKSNGTPLQILYSTNPSMFKFHDVNRDYKTVNSENRIKNIAESMKKFGFFPHQPITVTKSGWIVDGQHRVQAATKAGVGIYYIVNPGIPETAKGIFEAAKEMNKNNKVWSKEDYINGYVEMGHEDYETLQEFRKMYPQFKFTEHLMFLKNMASDSSKEEFSSGDFKIKSFKKACEYADNLLKLQPYFEKYYNKSQFVRTMLIIMSNNKKFDFDEFLHKVKLRPTSLRPCGDKRSYSEMIEEIYNYRRRNDEKIDIRFK